MTPDWVAIASAVVGLLVGLFLGIASAASSDADERKRLHDEGRHDDE